jgi:hypothetical protein
MKHTWTVSCGCGQRIDLMTSGTEEFPSTHCSKCGSAVITVNSYFVFMRIFNRGYQELHGGDNTLAIVLAAMSVETYVSFLYFKWKRIDFELDNQKQSSQAEEDTWEEELKNWRSVGARFDRVCQFLTKSKSFDSFVQNHSALTNTLNQHAGLSGNPSPKQWFQDVLFTKRNQIVHRGKIDYQNPDAQNCVDIARTLLVVFGEMDKVRIATLDARLGTAKTA